MNSQSQNKISITFVTLVGGEKKGKQWPHLEKFHWFLESLASLERRSCHLRAELGYYLERRYCLLIEGEENLKLKCTINQTPEHQCLDPNPNPTAVTHPPPFSLQEAAFSWQTGGLVAAWGGISMTHADGKSISKDTRCHSLFPHLGHLREGKAGLHHLGISESKVGCQGKQWGVWRSGTSQGMLYLVWSL